jgi:hypothetical protein
LKYDGTALVGRNRTGAPASSTARPRKGAKQQNSKTGFQQNLNDVMNLGPFAFKF